MDHHLLYILELHPTDLTRVLKMQFSIEITWTICTYLVKLSNVLLLARIFAGSGYPRFRLCLHLVHAFLLLWTAAAFFSVIFRCTPVQSFWDANPKDTCLHAQAGRIVTAALNSLTNVLLLSLPIRPVWQLHLPVMQKLAVVGMFGVGIFCLAASAVRLNYSVAAPRYHNHDPKCKYSFALHAPIQRVDTLIDMNAAPLAWASVEPCVGIVCACLPLMRPLFLNVHVRTLRRWFGGSLFGTKEADTWWHPPPEEFEKEDNITGHIECATKGADPDRNLLSVDRHKAEVKNGVVTVTEVVEGEPSVDITTRTYAK
jgi:hypothetical protein